MNTALIATVFYFVYSVCLGVLSGLVYRYEPSRWRYVPSLLAFLYYLFSFAYPHRVLKEAWAGTPSPGEDWRFTLSALAFAVGVYFVARILKRRAA